MIIDRIIFPIIILFIGIFLSYVILSVGCEYRDYSGGHKFIRAFRASGNFQRAFTRFQASKDISHGDLGKLTYLGYTGVVISSISAVLVLPTSIIINVMANVNSSDYLRKLSYIIFGVWVAFGVVWGIAAMIVQGIDSIINHF